MHLYLISHAHTQQDPAVDVRNWQLSAQGRAQAEALARLSMWGQVDCIVLSSEPKTRLTVQPLLAQGACSSVVDPRFDELLRPAWVDDYASRVRMAFAQPQESIGGWEAAGMALARFIDGIEALQRAHGDASLALISHGLVLSLYRAWLLGQSNVSFEDWRNLAFCAVALANPAEKRLLRDFEPVLDAASRG